MASKTLSVFALDGKGHSMVLYIHRSENEGMQHMFTDNIEKIISPHSEMILQELSMAT